MPDKEEFINQLKLKVIVSILKEIDETGFMAFEAENLVNHGMPIDNVPLYMKSLMDWFRDHKDDIDGNVHKLNIDTSEFERLMRNEMNSDQ
jgi:hypothetical protein